MVLLFAIIFVTVPATMNLLGLHWVNWVYVVACLFAIIFYANRDRKSRANKLVSAIYIKRTEYAPQTEDSGIRKLLKKVTVKHNEKELLFSAAHACNGYYINTHALANNLAAFCSMMAFLFYALNPQVTILTNEHLFSYLPQA